MANPLLGATLVILAIAVGLPVAALDGGRAYLAFVFKNGWLVSNTLGAWGIVIYYLLRRAASIVLMRGAGAKLRVE